MCAHRSELSIAKLWSFLNAEGGGDEDALAGRVAGLPAPLGNVCILVMTAFRVQLVSRWVLGYRCKCVSTAGGGS